MSGYKMEYERFNGTVVAITVNSEFVSVLTRLGVDNMVEYLRRQGHDVYKILEVTEISDVQEVPYADDNMKVRKSL